MARYEFGRLIASGFVSAALGTGTVVAASLVAMLFDDPAEFATAFVIILAVGWLVALLLGLLIGVPLALANGWFLLWLESLYPWASRRAAWVWWGSLVGFVAGWGLNKGLSCPWPAASAVFGLGGAAAGFAFRRMMSPRDSSAAPS